jgi:hypothetical protein
MRGLCCTPTCRPMHSTVEYATCAPPASTRLPARWPRQPERDVHDGWPQAVGPSTPWHCTSQPMHMHTCHSDVSNPLHHGCMQHKPHQHQAGLCWHVMQALHCQPQCRYQGARAMFRNSAPNKHVHTHTERERYSMTVLSASLQHTMHHLAQHHKLCSLSSTHAAAHRCITHTSTFA